MNWDAIGAIGEILGVAAVAVSLLYLARQLHVSAAQQKMEGHRAISEEFNRINEMWTDLDKTGMMLRAWSDWDAASAQEQHIASVFLMKVINHVQTMFFMWESNGIDESVYMAEEDFTCAILASDGGGKWWAMFKDGFEERFVSRINDKLDKGNCVAVTESVPFWKAEYWQS